MGAPTHPSDPVERGPLARRLAHYGPRLGFLCVLPLLLLFDSLFAGSYFLPQAPVLFEPLAAEQPEVADAVRRSAHYWTGDRILPVLTDQREMARRSDIGATSGWEPKLSLGLPLLGNALHGPLYPPNLLTRWLSPERAASWLAFLSMVLAGLGAWRFFERRGLPSAAAGFGALALQAAGFGAMNLHYGMKVDAVLWLPFCLTALEDLGAGKRFAGPMVLLFAALPFTAGFPPIALFALAVAVLYALVFLGGLRRSFGLAGEPRQGSLWRAVVLLALAPVVAAPALWPTVETSDEALRGMQTAADVESQSLPGVHALGLLTPHLWGRPSDPTPGGRQPAVWWFTPQDQWTKADGASPLEWDPWTGATLLGMAVLGFLRGGRRARFPALVLVLAFGFAQGWPLVSLAYHLPGFGAGAPARALSVAWLAWAWLGALGAAALVERRPGARRVVLTLFGVHAALATVLSSAIEPATFGGGMEKRLAARYDLTVDDVRQVIDPEHAVAAAFALRRSLEQAALLAGAAGILVLFGSLGRHGPRRRLPVALGLALVFDAALVTRAHTGGLDLPHGAELFPESPALAAVAEAADGARVWRLDPSPSHMEHTLALARPNLLQDYGISDVSAYVAFTPRRTVEYFTALDPRTRFRSGVGSLPDPALLDHPMVDRANVGAVLALAPVEHPSLTPAGGRPNFAVHRRAGALGPARLVPRAEVEPDTVTRLTRLADRGTDPKELVLIEEPPPSDWRGPGPGDSPAELVQFERPQPDRIRIRTRGGPAWLVVHEAWSDGWRARVNGEPATLFAGDHAFLALPLGPGDSEVELVYAPESRRAPWLAAGALLLGLVAMRRRAPLA